jgi:hypothetical protein
MQGTAVVQQPTSAVADSAKESYRRVLRWLKKADVTTATPQDIIEPRLSISAKAQ